MGSQHSPGAQTRHGTFLGCVFVCAAAWLSWLAGADVSVGDSGEIGTASYLLGVAHPTGFPLDLLLLRLAALLPLGTIAWRQGVGVALISAGVLTGLAHLVVRLAQRTGVSPAAGGFAGAALAVVALACFRTFLGTALGVEVYSTALLLNAFAALALLHEPALGALAWPAFGLALGAHVTAGFLMLPVLVVTLLAAPVQQRTRRLLSRSVPLLAAALVIAYLPLAARRDSVADWGDPETLGRLFAHLTAARIRSSFAHQMFQQAGAPSLLLFKQLGEHPWLLPLSLLGALSLLRRARAAGLVVLSVLTLDLGYAVWINPMGIADRQLGHTSGALLALLAGLGVARVCQRLGDGRQARWAAAALGTSVAVALLWTTPWPAQADGYVTAERFGSGSALVALPPRTAFLCASDSGCACALFALYVEAVRPDMAAVPEQHLWDATVLRRLTALPAASALSPLQPVAAAARGGLVDRLLRALLARPSPRLLAFEVDERARSRSSVARIAPLRTAPFFQVEHDDPAGVWRADTSSAVAALDRDMRARFGATGPRSELARSVWSGAYDALGKGALHAGEPGGAVLAEQRAVAVAPQSAVVVSNLGVALEAGGELARSLLVTRQAVLLAPERPVAWVNLTRLEARVNGVEAARQVLSAARLAGVRERRLDAMERALSQGSTR
ncbi:MAG TPA: DUF2723 domain-containing protein [Polyangiales bacterium]